MRHKIGDIVLVRSDLIEGKRYGGLYVLPSMKELCGKYCTIVGLGNVTYRLRYYNYVADYFTDEMLVNYITEFKIFLEGICL